MSEELCDTFWRSHGCDRPAGHNGPHQCIQPDGSICSTPNEDDVLYGNDGNDVPKATLDPDGHEPTEDEP
jgi:hypothetical protein